VLIFILYFSPFFVVINTNSNLNFNSLDLTLSTDPSVVMNAPLTLTEINTNELIN
jgi:hypothetical protein